MSLSSWGDRERKDNECQIYTIYPKSSDSKTFSIIGVTYNDGRYSQMKVPPSKDPNHDEFRTYNFPDSRLTTLDISNVARINCVQGKIRVLCYAKQRHNKDALFLLVDPLNFATKAFGENSSRLFIDFTDKSPFPPEPFIPI